MTAAYFVALVALVACGLLVALLDDDDPRPPWVPIDPEHERRVEEYIQANAPARGGRRLEPAPPDQLRALE